MSLINNKLEADDSFPSIYMQSKDKINQSAFHHLNNHFPFTTQNTWKSITKLISPIKFNRPTLITYVLLSIQYTLQKEQILASGINLFDDVTKQFNLIVESHVTKMCGVDNVMLLVNHIESDSWEVKGESMTNKSHGERFRVGCE